MRFGATVIHVPDVLRAVEFYERAFGIRRRRVLGDGWCAEMDTGDTALVFQFTADAKQQHETVNWRSEPNYVPPGFHLTFVVPDVRAAYELAREAGAVVEIEPTLTPSGEIDCWLLDLNGIAVRLVSADAPDRET